MKKNLLFLVLMISVLTTKSQDSFYWIGGASGEFNNTNSWNSALDGSGTKRSSTSNNDVLIIDGTNIGGTTPLTGVITPLITGSITGSGIGKLKLQNGANVVFQRGASGGSTFTISGDGSSDEDFTIDASSSLKITAIVAAQNFTLQLGVSGTTEATGKISGSIRIDDGGFGTATSTKLNAAYGPGCLVFANGGNLYFNNRSSTSSYGFTGTATSGIKFQSGSNLIYQGTSKMYLSTEFPFNFEKGSNIVFEANPNSVVSNRIFANVIIRNNAVVSFDGNPYTIDSLTITAGSTLNIRASSSTPVSGNIINNGTLGSVTPTTSSVLLMNGTTPQSISGTGTFNAIGSLHVAVDADVTLNTNILLNGTSTSTITGKLNAQSYTIGGTGNFQLRAAATATSQGTLTMGSNTITLDPLVYGSSVNTANVASGGMVSGTGIPANTYIIATSSGSSTITISKPATITSATLGAPITISNNAATFATSHPNGIDGNITTSGTKSYATGSNYIFNAATVTPFSTSTNNAFGNLTLNAPVTTNKNQNVGGTLTLGTGNLTIRAGDTLRITSGNPIAGSPNSNKYIITQTLGSAIGVLGMDAFATQTTFPVGTITNYLPASLTPVASESFNVAVYEGLTNDGTLTGTPMTNTQKEKGVNAAWMISRNIASSANCGLTLNWSSNLEGTTFSGFGNNQIGIGRINSGAWETVTGTGDNTTNTATSTFNNFTVFSVGETGFTLPIALKSFKASKNASGNLLQWSTDNEVSDVDYVVEKSLNGTAFSSIGIVKSSNLKEYSFTEFTKEKHTVFYRLKIKQANGSNIYSRIVLISATNNTGITIFPNPTTKTLFISGEGNLSAYKIIDITGKIISSQKLSTYNQSIDVSHLAIGAYLIELCTEDHKKISKHFIKQ